MIGMVLITHGTLGETMRAAMEHVVGPQYQVATVSIEHDDNLASCKAVIHDAMKEVDAGDGTLLLTDMFGSTPSNLALSMMGSGLVEVLAGVNLPMLVKLAKFRPEHTLAECASMAELAGRKYISTASHLPTPCLGGVSSCMDLPPPAMVPALEENCRQR